jgi:hypothetical protein
VFALIAIGLLLVTPLIMVVIRLVKPGFAYFWLAAAAGVLLAWPLVLLSGLDLPQNLSLLTWNPEEIFSGSPTLLIDPISWPYALAVASLAAAVILTAVARLPYVNWKAWAGTLTLGGTGILAVLSGNSLTLLLAWAALDLAELVILLLQVKSSAVRERIIVSFSARAAGILLVIFADLTGRTDLQPLDFAAIPASANIYLLLAAGLRLGVLPLHFTYFHELPLRRGLGTMLRLTPAAGSLVLLTRTAQNGVPEAYFPYLFLLVGISALLSAILWASAQDELSGRPYWLLGMASLSVAGALRGDPAASLAWGLALLLPGGLLFLFSARRRNFLLIPILGALSMSALPFTPAWEGMRIYAPPFQLIMPLFLFAHALLFYGYLRHSLRPSETLPGSERWVWLLYPLGLMLLLLSNIFAGFIHHSDLSGRPLAAWVAGPLAVGLAFLLFRLRRRLPVLPQPAASRLISFLSLNWLYSPLWVLYRLFGWLVTRLTQLLEGEGGVLWALVVLAIIFTLVNQSIVGR